MFSLKFYCFFLLLLWVGLGLQRQAEGISHKSSTTILNKGLAWLSEGELAKAEVMGKSSKNSKQNAQTSSISLDY